MESVTTPCFQMPAHLIKCAHLRLSAAYTRLLARVNANRGRPMQELKVLESMGLGNKKQLLLVQCGQQRVLVGLGGDAAPALMLLASEEGKAE